MNNCDARRTEIAGVPERDGMILKQLFEKNDDLKTRTAELFGHSVLFAFLDSMTDKNTIAESIIKPVMLAECLPEDGMQALDYIGKSIIYSPETQEIRLFSQVVEELMSGSALIFVDGATRALAMDCKGFDYRSVEESTKEVGELGSKESFIEVTNKNIAMITRRLMTSDLKFADVDAGRIKTRITLCYIEGVADGELVREIEARIRAASLPCVLEAGYLQSSLASGEHTIFPNIGSTTRPDVLCAKILEGRVGVLVEGTPEVLTLPYLFLEGMQSPDDYSNRPFFATFVRIIKLFASFTAVFLPGAYVALATFNPEAFPPKMLYNIIDADIVTPFGVATEGIIMLLLYEIMHEAGLRLPKPAGQGVSIVGSLVIGEAAVSSGLVGAPTIIIAAVSALCSYVAPAMYAQVAVMRFIFIGVGAISGIYGVMLVSAAVFISMCARVTWGVPFMAPLFPFDRTGARDSAVRASWSILGRREINITGLRGSNK